MLDLVGESLGLLNNNNMEEGESEHRHYLSNEPRWSIELRLLNSRVGSFSCKTNKDRLTDENGLEVDFEALDFSMPKLTMSSSNGNGFRLPFIMSEVSLSDFSKDTSYQSLDLRFKEWGFERGWSDATKRMHMRQ
ncbi:hypothetical protein DITRI_Ditri19aG0109100 [Diplodiscus trichospermus]